MNDTVEFLSITTEMVQFDGIRENNENVQGHSVNSSSKMRIRLSYWIHLSLENIDCFSIGRWNFNFRHFFCWNSTFYGKWAWITKKEYFFPQLHSYLRIYACVFFLFSIRYFLFIQWNLFNLLGDCQRRLH